MDAPIYEPQGFSLKIFHDRYAFTPEETWQEACTRVAHQMAIAEAPDKQKCYVDRFYDVLVKNLFVPGGRIWYNSGRTNPQLLNCFVLDPNKDSKEGWGKSAYDMIVTSMTGGGCEKINPADCVDLPLLSDTHPRGCPRICSSNPNRVR